MPSSAPSAARRRTDERGRRRHDRRRAAAADRARLAARTHRRPCAGRALDRSSASASSPIWRSRWNPELFAKYAPAYLSGLGVTLALVVISIVLGAILSMPIAYARMSRNPLLSGSRLRLCLFLPRHAAARADLPDLLRAGLVPAAARGDRPVGVLPRGLVLRDLRLLAEHRRLPGGNPARRDRERAQGPVGRRGLARPAQVPDACGR